MNKTILAALVTSALAGAALFWAAGHGADAAESKPASSEVAMQSDEPSRADALRERMEATRARIAQLASTPRDTGAKPPKPPKPRPPRPPRIDDTTPPTGPVTIDPACLANPLCPKQK